MLLQIVKMYPLLDKINSPKDLKELNIGQLKQLCSEIRSYIIEVCSQNPGHLASSLGVVELVVAMHYVYDAPDDKLVFDVGHQAYAHKIITGRREAFKTLRTESGISGFPNRNESEYDCFGVGHSSTSISAALGFAEGAMLQGLSQKVVALIGDGAMTGGLAFEGMNNAGASGADILVVLNDNNQSIDGNLGALHEHLLRLTTSSSYNRFKNRVWNFLGEGAFRNFIQRWIRSLKSWAVKRSGGDLFESLGFRYFGPIDGTDLEEVITTLIKIKNIKGPRILHCNTVKGNGYAPAEADPVTWHAPGRFDPKTGERVVAGHTRDRYQDVFGAVLCELAEKDPKVVGITPAMAQGCGMNLLAEKFPERFYDVGIEEEHAVTFAAGLAASGVKPFCNIYSSFAQRAYDQIIHDVALQKLPVVLCFDRAGLVGEDGATHHGAYDLASYRCIPNCIISSPRNELELKALMLSAHSYTEGPYIIRYPRGMGEGVEWRDVEAPELEIGKAEKLTEGSEVAIIAIGPVVNLAQKAAAEYPGKVSVYDFKFLKPFDVDSLKEIVSKHKHIITVEDGCLKGGLYGEVCECVMGCDYQGSIEGLGIPDEFIKHARQSDQNAKCGINLAGIEKSLKKYFASKK